MMSFLLVVIVFYRCNALQMPLREAADQADIFVGAALNYYHLQQDSQYAKTAGEQYNLMTAVNGCKWSATEPVQDEFNYTQCDYDLKYAQSMNMSFRGHNLCWGVANPSWLNDGNFTSDELKSILQSHIINVMQHYPTNSVYGWDVVNEAVSDNPSNGIYKQNVWYPAIPNYVELAFKYAAAGNNQTKLFYNDYNILMSNSWMQSKADAVYNMMKELIQSNIKIDGIGMQAHLNMANYPLDYNAMVSNLERFAELGLEIHITEMSVACGKSSNTPCSSFTNEIETKQAEMYQMVLRACMAVTKCNNFETWGFTDKYGAIYIAEPDQYPLPFDSHFQPKTAAEYIENQLLSTLIHL